MKSTLYAIGKGLTLLALISGCAVAGPAHNEKAGTPPPKGDAAQKASRAAEKKIEETLQGRSVARTAADVAITGRVKAALIEDASVDASGINVDTLNGVVYLRGTAENKAGAQRAYGIAKKIWGVKAVKSMLQYAPAGKSAGQSAKSKTPTSAKK